MKANKSKVLTVHDDLAIIKAISTAEDVAARHDKTVLADYIAIAKAFIAVRHLVTLNKFCSRWQDTTDRATSTIRTTVTYVIVAIDGGYDMGSFSDLEHLLQVTKRGGVKRDQTVGKRKALINEGAIKKANAKQLRDALAAIKAEMKARGL
jgi:hypothetical protein